MTLKTILLPIIILLSNCIAVAQEISFSFDSPISKPWQNLGDPAAFKVEMKQVIPYIGKPVLQIESLKKTNGFGGVMMYLPFNLKGDSIQLSARIKRENVTDDSHIGMMLHIAPDIFFENMSTYKINGTKDWENFTIKAKLNPDKTGSISIAFFLSGEGKIWVDDIKITVDNKDITKDKTTHSSFGKGIMDLTTTGINNFEATAQLNQRLVDLAKIWGFLKYRHPEVALGKIDWDNQLFTSIDAILKAKSNKEVEIHYTKLLDSLGNTEDFPKPIIQNVAHEIDYSWIDALSLNTTLKDKLKRVRYTSFDRHHYFGFTGGAGNVIFQNERKYDQAKSTDAGFRLLTLFRFWNMIEYFSPYKHLSDPNWDEVLRITVPEVITAKDDKSYGLTLLKLVARVKDAHTGLWSYQPGLQDFAGQYRLPIQVRMVEGQAVVTKLIEQENGQPLLQVGDVIVSKNLKTINELKDSLSTYILTPNEAVTNREMAQKLVYSTAKEVPLNILRDGRNITINVTTIPHDQFNPKNTDTLAFKILDNDILYVKHNKLTSKMIDKHMIEWSQLKGIIIDNRNYPEEFLVFKVGPLLLSKPTEFVRFTSTSLNQAGTFVMSPSLVVGRENSDYYQGKVAVLVNEDTQSSAEYHTMAYQTADNVKVFGSQTAGADGNSSQITLPGGQRTMLTGLGVYYPDKSETQRVGIKIDYKVNPTVQGIKEGRDEVLEAAIKYIKAK